MLQKSRNFLNNCAKAIRNLCKFLNELVRDSATKYLHSELQSSKICIALFNGNLARAIASAHVYFGTLLTASISGGRKLINIYAHED